jgi:hypothetical protein
MPRALTMLMPPAWEHDEQLPDEQKALYAYNAMLQEPWDGPAGVCFTDGLVVGATLDRNGLRPLRYDVTRDGWLVIASEAGAAQFDFGEIAHHGRLGPGEMVAADVEEGYWLDNDALKSRLAGPKRYAEAAPQVFPVGSKYCDEGRRTKDERHSVGAELTQLQAAFGYTSEELQVILKPMAWDASEAIGSMGDDTPHAVLSLKPRPLAHYFKQRFAEVTNPPIDPLRERDMMSLRCHLGPLPDPLATDPSFRRIVLASPFLSPAQLSGVEAGPLRSARLDATFAAEESLESGLNKLFAAAEAAIGQGAELLVLTDRAVSAERLLIPSLLAVSGLHHHLLRRGLRARVSLVAESGEARDTHTMAALVGFGANAVCPWLALETAIEMGADGYRGETLDAATVTRNFLKAAESGLLKIMSKMGIGPVESYCGAQLFEIIGLGHAVSQRHFTGTPSRVSGIGLDAGMTPRGTSSPSNSTAPAFSSTRRRASTTPSARRWSTPCSVPSARMGRSTVTSRTVTPPTTSTRACSTAPSPASRATCSASSNGKASVWPWTRWSRRPPSSAASRRRRCLSAPSAARRTRR